MLQRKGRKLIRTYQYRICAAQTTTTRQARARRDRRGKEAGAVCSSGPLHHSRRFLPWARLAAASFARRLRLHWVELQLCTPARSTLHIEPLCLLFLGRVGCSPPVLVHLRAQHALGAARRVFHLLELHRYSPPCSPPTLRRHGRAVHIAHHAHQGRWSTIYPVLLAMSTGSVETACLSLESPSPLFVGSDPRPLTTEGGE